MSTTQTNTAEMTTGSVISRDGIRIGYLCVGRGPAVVLLHGSNESARSHTRLALALADAFTAYLPDRRAAAACPGPTARTTASAPRSRICRPSSTHRARNGSSGSASAR